jgi:hypothetical protein
MLILTLILTLSPKRAKDSLIAAGHKPNNDTYIPILAKLTQHGNVTGMARIHKEMQAHHIVRDAYTQGHGEAVVALAKRGGTGTCGQVLQAIAQSQGTLAATQALNFALGKLSVQGLVQARSSRYIHHN